MNYFRGHEMKGCLFFVLYELLIPSFYGHNSSIFVELLTYPYKFRSECFEFNGTTNPFGGMLQRRNAPSNYGGRKRTVSRDRRRRSRPISSEEFDDKDMRRNDHIIRCDCQRAFRNGEIRFAKKYKNRGRDGGEKFSPFCLVTYQSR